MKAQTLKQVKEGKDLRNQPQYTQGEWSVNDLNEIYSEFYMHIATVHTNKTKEIAEANAQRIVTCVNEYDSLKKKEAMHDELIIGLRKIMNGAMANLDSGKKLDKVYTAIEQLLKQAEQK